MDKAIDFDMNNVQNIEHCSFLEFPMFQLHPPTLEAIRNTRLGLGLSIAEAAGLVYATPRAWSHWETGARQINNRGQTTVYDMLSLF